MSNNISFPKSITLSRIESYINSIFSECISFKSSSTELQNKLIERVINPLNEKSGARPKHSNYLKGYAQGYISACRKEIQYNYIEFCYVVDNKLYSTHKESNRPKTSGLPEEIYRKLGDYPNGFFWKDSDKRYS